MRRLIAIIAAALIVGSLLRVWAQEPDRIPGPIIEDPPGTSRVSVRRRTDRAQPGRALSTFVVTYNGFTPQAQRRFRRRSISGLPKSSRASRFA